MRILGTEEGDFTKGSTWIRASVWDGKVEYNSIKIVGAGSCKIMVKTEGGNRKTVRASVLAQRRYRTTMKEALLALRERLKKDQKIMEGDLAAHKLDVQAMERELERIK